METTVDEKGPGPPPPDRRHSERHRSLKAGRIVFGNLAISYDVIIRNMSDSGARLQVDANANVPGDFYFIVVADHLVARAHVVWRTPKEVGIHYLEPLRSIRDHPDPRVARMIVV
jgi:hypothetical protein